MTPAERLVLIDALCEGDISEADFLRLEAELTIDPVARRDYYNRITISLLLETEATASSSRSEPRVRSAAGTAASSRRWLRAFVGTAVVAAALLVVVTLQTQSLRTTADSERRSR